MYIDLNAIFTNYFYVFLLFSFVSFVLFVHVSSYFRSHHCSVALFFSLTTDLVVLIVTCYLIICCIMQL